jgi:hypothetical protein
MVATMEAAFVDAIAQKAVASIAERDRIAVAEGMRYRCVYRLNDGRRYVGYGETYDLAYLCAFDATDLASAWDAAYIAVTPLTEAALRYATGPHYPDDFDEI